MRTTGDDIALVQQRRVCGSPCRLPEYTVALPVHASPPVRAILEDRLSLLVLHDDVLCDLVINCDANAKENQTHALVAHICIALPTPLPTPK